MIKPKGLGRGLDALLGGNDEPARKDASGTLPVTAIRPGKYQPRTRMDEQALQELAASIRAQGLMQPLLVRPVASNGREKYELIAGERRWRAAQLAGLTEVPALIREVPDTAALAMALIENIQREDLNLVDEFGMTHEQAADAVGRSRSATSNLLRLLRLSKPVQDMVMGGQLEMGHARALLSLDGARQVEIAHQIAGRGLSVREAEALSRKALKAPQARAGTRKTDRDLQRLEEEVSQSLGTTVEIRPGRKGSGTILVRYAGLDHLDQLLKRLR
jgi:ParB family chromosome partitioning protein